MLLSGCCTFGIGTKECFIKPGEEVPRIVEVTPKCNVEIPNRPVMPIDQLSVKTASDADIIGAALTEIDIREAYEVQLTTRLIGCKNGVLK